MNDAAVSRARGKTFSTRAATPVAAESRMSGGKPVSLARLAPTARALPEGERSAMGRAVDWTPEMLGEMRRLYADGWTVTRLARLIGVGAETARAKCRALGLPPRPPGTRGLSPAEDAMLREMLVAGVALDVVADELGRGLAVVASRAAALGFAAAARRVMDVEIGERLWSSARDACAAHLADLRRAGHDPRATELRIGAEGHGRWRGPASSPMFSGCGSPAASCAEG